MAVTLDPQEEWRHRRDRLAAKGLLAGESASLSLRIPDANAMWLGMAEDEVPRRLDRHIATRGATASEAIADVHAAVYAARDDVCAIVIGGGAFGLQLKDFGGAMPGVFDEQVRHLGRMAAAVDRVEAIAGALAAGGNALLVGGRPMVLGMTPSRLAMNAELFEKCATAYVLAVASGGPVRPLPWIVRHVANRRLMKDEQRARGRVRAGLAPEETKGY
ncbi:hypothetical protein [Roseateles sp.]|uniref:hypothetical protein n=1 Tax=Roseateles sp. TaxID=1971397 RepID=UPI0031D53045